MALNAPYYTKTQVDSKVDPLKVDIQSIENEIVNTNERVYDLELEVDGIADGTGGKSYPDIATAMAVAPLPSNGTIFTIDNSNLTERGVYAYDSNEVSGYRFVRDYTPNGVVEEGNTQAVSGGEVWKKTTDAYSIFNRERINLINPDAIEIGYLNEGIFSSNPNYKTTGFIECKNGDVVRVTNGLNWAVYDVNFQLVDKIVGFNFATFTVNHIDAKYFRIDNVIGATDWMCVVNQPLPSVYVSYDEYSLSFNNDSESGKVINEQIELKSKVKELHINFFDENAISVGYLNDEGNVIHHTNYYTSDFIKVDYNDVVAGGFGGYCFYDENKNFVSKHYVPGASNFIVDDANVKYIRVDNQLVNLPEQMITIGFKEQPFYIPYERKQYSFESSDPWRYSWLTSKNRGLRWLTLGDSICNGIPHGYRQQTTIQLDLININHAKDGATIGYFPDGARVISEYIDTITDDADIITVHAMVNDCSGGLPIGTWSDTTNTTFYGAYRMVAEKLLNKFTGKKIAFMTAIQRVGNTDLKPYVDVIKEVGAFYGIPVLDLNANCGLYPDLTSYRQFYDEIGLHPNLEGHKIITPKVVDFINSL